MDSYPGFVGYVRTENEFESLKEIYIYNDYPQDPTMDEDGMLRIQKYPDTCGFKNIRIRADGDFVMLDFRLVKQFQDFYHVH